MRWSGVLLVAGLLMAQEFDPLSQFGAGRSRGVGWADYDQDGDLDLGVTNLDWDLIYRNEGPRFLVADSLAPEVSFGIAWADYDNDGWLDLALATKDGVVIYGNREGVLRDSIVLLASGARGVAWADYNRDGWVDLAVACWGRPNLLYRNDEGLAFDLVVAAFGNSADSSMGLAWADYDRDGDPDLAVANFMGPNKLYRNDGGSFAELTPFGLAEEAGMGVAWSDYNRDGWVDLALTNLCMPNRLYRNNRDGSFTEVVGAFGGSADSSRGLSWGDYDLDGDFDLVVTNFGSPSKLYRNEGGDSFTELLPFGSEADSSYGVARGDYDRDGDLDLAVARDGDNRLYRNKVGGGGRYLRVRVLGRGGGYTNRDGVGAKVSVYVRDSLVGFQECGAGSGFCSMDALDLVFGVADSCDVEVRWLSGIVDRVKGIEPPQELLIYEDQRPPQDPDSVWSESHEIGRWSSAPVIRMRWSKASDPEGSGVKGYSWAFHPDSLFLPDTLIDGTETACQSPPLTCGVWFFHLRCVDSVGNWSAGVRRGRYLLDPQPPAPPESLYANGELRRSRWTRDPLFTIRWVESPVPTSLKDRSGIRAAFYKLGAEPSHNYDTTGTAIQNPFGLYWSREGVTPLYLWLQDSLGNLDHRNHAWVDLRYDSTPPSPPGLVSPTGGVSINQERPWFIFRRAGEGLSGVMGYKIQVGTNPFFDPPEWEAVVQDTICRAGVALPEGRLFWQVQAQDSAGNRSDWSVDSLRVDLTPPRVVATHPPNGATDVPLSANILVAFSEPMDSTTIKPGATFRVTGNLAPPIEYEGTVGQVGGNYLFDPHTLFRPRDGIICRLTTAIKDLAGNGLQEDYAWGFTAGERLDTLGPRVSNFRAWPNPTRGADTLFLRALISDEGRGDQPIQRAEYFIDHRGPSGTGYSMRGDFGISTEMWVVDTISKPEKVIGVGPHWLYLHAQDLSNNWGPYDSVEVWVTAPDTIPPKLELEIAPKELSPGDTLSIHARSNERLLKWRSWVRGLDGAEYPVDLWTGDSISFSCKFPIVGLPLGRATVGFFGTDGSGNSSSVVDSFSVRMGEELLPRDLVYIWPNPVGGDWAHFRYTLKANGNVSLMIYTLDGRKVLTRHHLGVQGGVTGEFKVDVSSLPNDLYFFKLRAETLDERVVEEVVKRFVVLR